MAAGPAYESSAVAVLGDNVEVLAASATEVAKVRAWLGHMAGRGGGGGSRRARGEAALAMPMLTTSTVVPPLVHPVHGAEARIRSCA